MKIKRNDGITVIEVAAAATISVLVVALGFSFQGWIGGYRVESQVKELYVDMMNARVSAMQRNRAHFVDLATPGQYTIYEDTNPSPNGNGTLEISAPADTQVLQKILSPEYPITWNGDTEIEFTSRGLSNDLKTICSSADADADYDCLVLSRTRINLGKLTSLSAACRAANCDTR